MVDRYILPVPKTRNIRMYVRLRNKALVGIPSIISFFMVCFQFNRYLQLRTVNNFKFLYNYF